MSVIALLAAITPLGAPALFYGFGRLVRDVWIAKINAKTRVEVTRLRYGYRQDGGRHRH